MSDLSDAMHEAVVAASAPFVGTLGAQVLGTALEFVGAVVSGNWDDSDTGSGSTG